MEDIEQLDEDEKAYVFGLLPENLKNISRLIGLELALRLAAEFGGESIRFRKTSPVRPCEIFQRLVDLIGESSVFLLGREFSDGPMYIAAAKTAARFIRNRKITSEFSAMIRQGKSTNTAANALAKKYQISYRAVEKIVNRPS